MIVDRTTGRGGVGVPLRAPGQALHRMPVFAWAMLVFAFMMIFVLYTFGGWNGTCPIWSRRYTQLSSSTRPPVPDRVTHLV